MAELGDYPEIEKWLKGKRPGTQIYYKTAMKAYIDFTGLNPTQMIDEVEEDRKKSPRDWGQPEDRILDFNKWLQETYEQRKAGKKTGKIGISSNLAGVYCAAIKSFYTSNNFPLKVKIPKGKKKKKNFKLKYRAPEVRKLLNVTTSLRDRAIVMSIYQSGMGVSEICQLDYGDIKKDFEEEKASIQIHLIREKTYEEYDTFLGKESINFLKLYIRERMKNGKELEFDTPLFTKEGAKKLQSERVTVENIDTAFRVYAVKSGLVTEKQLKVADLNPARPHALRAAFQSILKLAGMNDAVVEYMAGHNIGETQRAYWLARTDELRDLYEKHEVHLSVFAQKVEVQRLEKLEQRVLSKDDQIRLLVENGRLKEEKLARLNSEVKELTRRMEGFEAFVNRMRELDEEIQRKRELAIQREKEEDKKEATASKP